MQKNETIAPEELLRPRYKVIALWPGMHAEPFRLGQIITLQPYEDEDYKGFIHIPIKHMPGSFMREGFFSGYPHLFKKLEWWEDRAIEDMPEYVKIQRFYEHIPCAVYKVGVEAEWNYSDACLIGIKFISGGGTMPNYTLPASAAEYEDYINKKNNDDTPTH